MTRSIKIIIGLISLGAIAVVGTVSYLAYKFYQDAKQTLDDKNKQQPVTGNQTPQVIYQTTSGSNIVINEVITALIPLSGTAPANAKWGIDTVTGKTYYVDTSGNWAVMSASVSNTSQIVNLASKLVKNGNVEKFTVPCVALTTDKMLINITTDVSSESLIYHSLGVQKDNLVSIQVSNFTGNDLNTIPLTISILKFS